MLSIFPLRRIAPFPFGSQEVSAPRKKKKEKVAKDEGDSGKKTAREAL